MIKNNDVLSVIKPSASILLEPKTTSVLTNEALFGEKVTILDIHKDFFLTKLKTDSYKGWINKHDLGILPKANYRVIKLRTNIYLDENIKKPIVHYLPFGSLLKVLSSNDKWVKIQLSNFHANEFGFVPKKDVIKLETKIHDWVKIAKMFINVPYKWGGRNSIGIDCSALVQLSLVQTMPFPRDTKFQIKNNFKKISIENITKGCLIFWKGHVGIMINKENMIHANAYNMRVNVEKLKEIDKRAETKIHKIVSIIRI